MKLFSPKGKCLISEETRQRMSEEAKRRAEESRVPCDLCGSMVSSYQMSVHRDSVRCKEIRGIKIRRPQVKKGASKVSKALTELNASTRIACQYCGTKVPERYMANHLESFKCEVIQECLAAGVLNWRTKLGNAYKARASKYKERKRNGS